MTEHEPEDDAVVDGGDGAGDPHLLVGAYALDALGDEERAVVEAHLEGCAACREELAGFAATAAALADAVAEPPAPATRAAVLAAADVTRQDPPSLAARRAGASGGAARGARPVLVAAALVLVALVAAGATAWWARADVDRLEEIEQIATAPDATTVVLTGTGEGAGGGSVRVTASAALGRGLVVADGLAGLPEDRTYQLWVIDDAGPAPVDTFRPDAEGRAELVTATDLTGAAAMGLTEEPAGGSPQPTGDILYVVELGA